MQATPASPTRADQPQLPQPPPATEASEVVASLRGLAAEVAEESVRRPGPSLRTLSLSLRRDKSSEFRVSREYDFEAAQSPQAG